MLDSAHTIASVTTMGRPLQPPARVKSRQPQYGALSHDPASATPAPDLQATAAEGTFRSLLEAAPDAIVIVDTNGCITIVNTQVERTFGYGRSELIGQPIEILVPTRFHHM